MKPRDWLTVLGGLLAGGLSGAGWGVYAHRSRLRVAGTGSVDDPAVAAAYGQITRLPPMRYMRRLVTQRAVGLTQQGRALDLGCGPGLLTCRLAQRIPGLRVVGVDLSAEMLAQARQTAVSAGVANRVRFEAGDVQAIPCANGSFDLVVSTLSLHHWAEPLGVLDEIARVLRPGGAFVIFDLRRDLGPLTWLGIWLATRLVVPRPLRQVNEPLNSRNAAYTATEAAALAQRSRLRGWRVTSGPLWLTIEGRMER